MKYTLQCTIEEDQISTVMGCLVGSVEDLIIKSKDEDQASKKPRTIRRLSGGQTTVSMAADHFAGRAVKRKEVTQYLMRQGFAEQTSRNVFTRCFSEGVAEPRGADAVFFKPLRVDHLNPVEEN